MKNSRLFACISGCLLLTGCVSPNWSRLVPENKDASIKATIVTPWGTQTFDIETRVNPSGRSGLPKLP